MAKKKRQLQSKNKETKLNIMFDDKARENYLKGFKKRKDERRKKAKEQAEFDRKKIKQQLRLKKKEHCESRIKEFQEAVKNWKENVFDLPRHTVTVTNDLSLDDGLGLRLGVNSVTYDDPEKKTTDRETDSEDDTSKDKSSDRGPSRKARRQAWLKKHKLHKNFSSEKHHKRKPLTRDMRLKMKKEMRKRNKRTADR